MRKEKQAVDQVDIPVLDQNRLEIVVRGVKNRRQPHGAGDHALSQQSDRAEYNSAGKRFLHQWLHDSPLLSTSSMVKLPTAPFISTLKELENRIDRIDTIECRFVVLSPSTWDTIFESDPVKQDPELTKTH